MISRSHANKLSKIAGFFTLVRVHLKASYATTDPEIEEKIHKEQVIIITYILLFHIFSKSYISAAECERWTYFVQECRSTITVSSCRSFLWATAPPPETLHITRGSAWTLISKFLSDAITGCVSVIFNIQSTQTTYSRWYGYTHTPSHKHMFWTFAVCTHTQHQEQFKSGRLWSCTTNTINPFTSNISCTLECVKRSIAAADVYHMCLCLFCGFISLQVTIIQKSHNLSVKALW